MSRFENEKQPTKITSNRKQRINEWANEQRNKKKKFYFIFFYYWKTETKTPSAFDVHLVD